MSEEIKQAIIDVFEKNLKKGKKKLYMKDVVKSLPDFSRSDVKKQVQDMMDKELAYWSSGSTTYLMLMDEFNKYKEEAEGHEE